MYVSCICVEMAEVRGNVGESFEGWDADSKIYLEKSTTLEVFPWNTSSRVTSHARYVCERARRNCVMRGVQPIKTCYGSLCE